RSKIQGNSHYDRFQNKEGEEKSSENDYTSPFCFTLTLEITYSDKNIGISSAMIIYFNTNTLNVRGV
ncbi:hypothetical protein NXY55_27610, partial [Aeromonas veronii]|nr:hypothetical protein [Aeromonas veronii]